MEVVGPLGLSSVLFVIFRDRISRLRSVQLINLRIASLLFASMLSVGFHQIETFIGLFAAQRESGGISVSTSESNSLVLCWKMVIAPFRLGASGQHKEVQMLLGLTRVKLSVMEALYLRITVRKKLSLKVKLSIYQLIYVQCMKVSTLQHTWWSLLVGPIRH